jgi:phosphatidylglycerol:prolipoprotein diacylglycerol transferase
MTPGIDLGIFTVRYYGIIIMTGAVLAAFLADWRARKHGLNPEIIWDSLIWALVGGILGARLWHILLPSQSDAAKGLTTLFYLTHPLDALSIWKGGLGIPGAVIGGMLAIYIFCRRNKLAFLPLVDLAAPSLALGQAVGRWGNFVNQELYGAPTNLPWAITIDPPFRLPEYANVATYHPLFLYESLWNLANMVILLWLDGRYREHLKPGDLLLVYAVIYPLGRFLLDFLRLDVAVLAGLNANQAIMAGVAVAAGITLFWRNRPQPQA